MKLLLDQNLSWKLVKQLQGNYPGTEHIKTALTIHAEDIDIWQFAADNGFVVVSKDDDFEQRSILLGHPPKVIWITLGNCKTSDIEALLINSEETIQD